MMGLDDLFTAWSAAHTIWFGGAILLAGINFPSLSSRERWLAVFSSLVCLGMTLHQGDATWRWALDMFKPSQVTPFTWGYRICWSIGAVGFAGVSSWERCGHRGWLGLLLVGLIVGAMAVVASP